jgi:gliding motility-associated-like protein
VFSLQLKAQALVADFSANVVSGCGPLPVNFKDLSTGSPNSWTWDLGNGQFSNVQNPSTTYSIPGTYTVTLIVKNTANNTISSERKTDYIVVFPYPTAAFSSNLRLACAPSLIQFTDLSTPGQGSIAKWNWNFGDGNSSPQPSPANTFTQTGYYNVSLTVTNSQGCANTLSSIRYLRVVQGVQADFAWTQTSVSCSAPFAVTFNNQTSGPGNLSYTWDLGNGNNSNLPNPATTYPANTNYTVTLNAQSDLGCSQTTKKTVSFAAGNAVITGPDSACVNSLVSFANGSSPAPLSFSWDFGDGHVSAATAPGNTYTAAATYPVKLVNQYTTCVDSVIKNIKIVNSPIPDFGAIGSTISCKTSFTVNFHDSTAPGTVSKWQWDFGDGGSSNQQSPSHTYTTAGSFNVTLTAANGVGCSGTITKPNFVLIQAPTVTLVNPGIGGCVNTDSLRPLASVVAVDGIAGYLWNSGGGSPATSVLPAPAFTYPAQGSYNLTLTVTTTGGCSVTTTFNNAISIGDSTTPIFFATPTDACASSPITFTSPSSPVTEWLWDFGHGDTSQSAPPVKFTFRDTGNRAVSLTVINHGCAKTIKQTLVHIKPPIARFQYAIDCTQKLVVDFTDSTVIDPSLGATYTWDYGDFSAQVTYSGPPLPKPPPHSYAVPKTYIVSLTVVNGGCPSSYTQNIILAPQIADLAVAPDSPCRKMPFTASAIGSDPTAIAAYFWKIGGLGFVAGGRGYTTQVTDTGSYPIDLIIVDNNGCSDTASLHHPYSFQVTGPYAKYSLVGIGGCKNSPIQFLDQSTPYPGNPLIRWAWNFGDGGSDIVQNPTHRYTDTSFYLTQLNIQDSKGCADTYRDPVLVHITAPKAGFFAKDTLYCPNLPLPFTDSSKGDGLSWAWDFGDGGSSTGQNPVHPFTTNGNHYTIKLTITDSVGCADSMTRVNYIDIQKPIAAFTLDDSTAICPPLQTSFTPNGQYYDSLYWDFGDGTTSTLPVTTHFYNTYDTFTAKLILRGAGGCLDSASRRVFVLNPTAVTTFIYSPVRNCDSVLTNFTIVPPGFTRFTLAFGDTQSDNSGNTLPKHTYKFPATYSPQLILTDSTGCIVIIPGSPNVVVLGSVPFFTIDKHALCDSGTVSFSDFTISNDKPLNETWDFGDGTSTIQPNPAHDYTTPGVRLATLTVSTANNCIETFTDTVRVYQTPHPVFTITNPFCATAPLQFLGSITAPLVDSIIWDWNFGDGQGSALQNPLIVYPRAGQYSVSLKTSVLLGCSDTVSQSVVVHALPPIKGPATITTPLGFPVTIPFIYGNDIVSYTWTPAANLSCTDCPNPIANPIFKTEYTVTIVDSNNCMNTDSILVSTVCNGKNYFLPNTFSPNGDGVNDAFYPRGTSIFNIQSMKVFNRWGQKVFERRDFPANSPSDGWDGTINHRQAPVDVYVYIVEVVCENAQVIALNGNVTLVR